jgi:hypothetical protein
MTSGFRWEVPASYSLAGTVPDKHEPDRPAVGRPPSRPGPLQAALGRDHQVVRVGVQGLGDQLPPTAGP